MIKKDDLLQEIVLTFWDQNSVKLTEIIEAVAELKHENIMLKQNCELLRIELGKINE